MGQPEIYLNAVGDAFDDKGELIKESLQKVLQQYIDAFAAFVEKHNVNKQPRSRWPAISAETAEPRS